MVDIDVLDSQAFTAAVARALAQGTPRAVVLIEVRGSGAVNAAAEARIARTIRPHDVVGRLEEGRLAVLTAKDGATRVATRLGDRLREPFNVGAHQVKVTPLVGVGYSGEDVRTPEDLLLAAESSPKF